MRSCLAEPLASNGGGAGAAALAGAMHLRRRHRRRGVGIVLSGGQTIHIPTALANPHGELCRMRSAARSSAAQLADMEYGARGV